MPLLPWQATENAVINAELFGTGCPELSLNIPDKNSDRPSLYDRAGRAKTSPHKTHSGQGGENPTSKPRVNLWED